MFLIGERSKFSCLKIYDDTSSSNENNSDNKLMSRAASGQVFVRIKTILKNL